MPNMTTDFVAKLARYYVGSIQNGLTYELAYETSLANTASDYNFTCTPNKQELRLYITINQSYFPFSPPEIKRLVQILGRSGAELRLSEMYVSCLDGTLLQNGFDELAVTGIITKFLDYFSSGFLNVRIACECDTASQDPCRVLLSITNNRNVKYSLDEDQELKLAAQIETLLSNTSGVNYEIENISTLTEIQEVQTVFLHILNILYQTGGTAIDPNSGESAAAIRDFFDQASTPDPNDPTRIKGFEAADLAVLLALINPSGKASVMSSLYTRLVNKINKVLSVFFGNTRQIGGSITTTPDYSTNSVMFSSLLQFEKRVSSCDPSKAPSITNPKISLSCECKEEKQACSVSFLANVVTKPVIYEVPYFYASGRALAELPTPPDVQFIPFKDIDSKMLINLNTTAGRYTTKFVPITTSDQEYLSNLATSRGVGIDSLFTFEGDPTVQYYEAFRIETHPKSYLDFEVAQSYIFQNNQDSFNRYRNREVFRDINVNSYSNGISQEHTFIPNKKYYYIFRTVDVNNNISNPTKVFEIEMINNGGAVFPVIRVVDFITSTSPNYNIDMRRLFMLTPSPNQVDILGVSSELQEQLGITTASDAVRSLKLTDEADSAIWNKRYKIRFTSIDTGRMLDLNITPTTRIVDPFSICGPKVSTSSQPITSQQGHTFDQA